MCCVHLPTPCHPLCRSSIHLASACGARLLYEYVVGKMREAHFPHNILPRWLCGIMDRWCVVGSKRRGTDFPHNTTYFLAGAALWHHREMVCCGERKALRDFCSPQHTISLASAAGASKRRHRESDTLSKKEQKICKKVDIVLSYFFLYTVDEIVAREALAYQERNNL